MGGLDSPAGGDFRIGAMPSSLTIGDFAKATHLTVKTLRHYHETGVLQPAEVDPQTGYRRYTTAQIPTAQIIRRFRDLEMPLSEIQAVLSAPDVKTRNDLIASHLDRLEGTLTRTQSAVTSLRDLLQHPAPAARIGHRKLEATTAAAITQVVAVKDLSAWFRGALGELSATLSAQEVPATSPAGGIYSNAIFTHARGDATVFLPCSGAVRPVGRVTPFVVPAIELATIEHRGSHANVDIAYGALATYVSQHALAVDGPLREYYLVGQLETWDQAAWRTEIGWPIFQTR
jgi:DNA-binding transcriptional MerR regulator